MRYQNNAQKRLILRACYKAVFHFLSSRLQRGPQRQAIGPLLLGKSLQRGRCVSVLPCRPDQLVTMYVAAPVSPYMHAFFVNATAKKGSSPRPGMSLRNASYQPSEKSSKMSWHRRLSQRRLSHHFPQKCCAQPFSSLEERRTRIIKKIILHY